MAQFSSSNDKLNRAIKNLKQEEINELNNNTSLIENIGEVIFKNNKDNDEDEDEGSLKKFQLNTMQTLTKLRKNITDSLSTMTGHLHTIYQSTAQISSQLGTINALIASNSLSLMNITGVLSAFRADFLLGSNGQNVDGRSYINTQLITKSAYNLSSDDKSVRKILSNMRNSGNFAKKMADVVKSKIGNNDIEETDGQGIFSKILGKLDPEIAETLGALTPLASMFGIDDTNIKTLLGTTFKSKKKTLVDPLNEFIGNLLNSTDESKGSDIKKLLAGKFRDLTGFGTGTKINKKENNPKMVMSALAPYADDIKQIVEAKYDAYKSTPKSIMKLAPYAKLVWVVNSQYQKNGFEESKDVNKDDTFEIDLLEKKIEDLISGNATNKRDKNGKELYRFDPSDSSFEGSLIDQYNNHKNNKDKSYNDKMVKLLSMRQNTLENKNKNYTQSRVQTLNPNTGEYEENIVQHDKLTALANVNIDRLGGTVERVLNPVGMIPEVIGGNLGGIKNDFLGSFGDIKSLLNIVMKNHHSGKLKGNGDNVTIANLAKGEKVVSEEELEEQKLNKEKLSTFAMLSGSTTLAFGVFKTLSSTLVRFLNKEEIDPNTVKIPSFGKDDPFKDAETKGSDSGAVASGYIGSIKERFSKLTSGLKKKAKIVHKEDNKKKNENDKDNEEENKKPSGIKGFLKELFEGEEKKNENDTSEATPSEENEQEDSEQVSQAEPSQAEIEEQEKQDELNQESQAKIAEENELARQESEATAAAEREKENEEYLAAEEKKRNAEKEAHESGENEREKLRDKSKDRIIKIQEQNTKNINKEKKSGYKQDLKIRFKSKIREKGIRMKQWFKEKKLKLKASIKENAKKIGRAIARNAKRLAKAIGRLARRLLKKGKNIAKKLLAKQGSGLIEKVGNIGKNIISLIGKGVTAIGSALSGAIITAPIAPIAIGAGIVGLGATAALIYKAIKKGKSPSDNSNSAIGKANKVSESEQKKEKQKKKKKTSLISKIKDKLDTVRELKDNILSKNKNTKNADLNKNSENMFSYMTDDMKKMAENNMNSELGKTSLRDPEKAAGAIFSMNGGSSIMNLGSSSPSDINNLNDSSSIASGGISGIITGLTNTATNSNNSSGRSTNIADKNNGYSENVEIAYQQYKQANSNMEFVNSLRESMGLDVLVGDDGKAISTSEIVKKEQMNALNGNNSLQTTMSSSTTANNNSNTTSSSIDYGTVGNGSSVPKFGTSRRSTNNVMSNEFLNASKFALSKGYKETDGGTYPQFFKDYLGKSNINVNNTSSTKDIKSSLLSGNPVILMGKDAKESGSTPFGAEPHYVVATGYDGKNITVEDSESPTGQNVYNADELLRHSSIKMITSSNKRYGTGNSNSNYNNNNNGIKYLKRDNTFSGGSNSSKTSRIFNKLKKNNVKYGKGFDKWVFCGDSRTVGLGSAIGNIETIAKIGEGYDFLVDSTSEIKSKIGYNIVLWFGVNDLNNHEKYKFAYNTLAKVMDGKSKIIVCTVGPCQDKYKDDKLHGGAGQSVAEFNKQITNFNEHLLEGLSSNIEVIDIYSTLQDMINKGQDITEDCLHYNTNAYQEVYKAMTSGKTISPTTASSNISTTNLQSMGTVSMQLDSYVDGSVLEKYLKNKTKSSGSTATKNNSSSQTKKSNNKSNNSILNNVLKEAENISNGNNNDNNKNSLISNDYVNAYEKDGTVYVKNNSDFIDRTQIEDILNYFKNLNDIQDDSLEVIEVIYEKLRKQRGKPSKIKDSPIRGIHNKTYSTV